MGPNSYRYDQIKRTEINRYAIVKKWKVSSTRWRVFLCAGKVVLKCLLFYLVHADIIYFGCILLNSWPCMYFMCEAYASKDFVSKHKAHELSTESVTFVFHSRCFFTLKWYTLRSMCMIKCFVCNTIHQSHPKFACVCQNIFHSFFACFILIWFVL